MNKDAPQVLKTASVWLVVGYGVAVCALQSPVAAADPAKTTADENRSEMLENLAKTIAVSVRKSDTQHPVFHGCIDWHSAVHGHWALLRVAATTGKDDELADWVAAALAPEGIAEEATYLREHPQFEMPYGRAWFLRLAIEFDTWAARHAVEQPGVLNSMADEVAVSLDHYYTENTPAPNSREYRNDAWALVQLFSFYQHRADEAGVQRVRNLVRDHFVTSDAKTSFADDFRRPEFFSRFGNWAYLIARTQDRCMLADFCEAHPISEDDLKPVEPAERVAHNLGTNWSRAWALRALADRTQNAAERERFERAYAAHVAAGMAQHEKSKDDYRNYGHWVPQFGVYAITDPNP